MRRLVRGSVLLALAAVVGCYWVSRDKPLLLEEGDPPAKGLLADNSRCHVCHLNYSDEKLAVQHVKANVGCEKCHGRSDDHCSDEDNLTPPDTMYPAAKINPSCLACHPKKKLGGDAAHDRTLAGSEAGYKLCTDCHGRHRLARRTVEWDKATGKLLP